MNFMKKHWKTIVFISVLILCVILGIIFSKILGGFGMIGISLWKIISKNKSKNKSKNIS